MTMPYPVRTREICKSFPSRWFDFELYAFDFSLKKEGGKRNENVAEKKGVQKTKTWKTKTKDPENEDPPKNITYQTANNKTHHSCYLKQWIRYLL